MDILTTLYFQGRFGFFDEGSKFIHYEKCIFAW